MNYLELLAPDFSLILCGYLICRFTPLDRTVWDQVEKLVYYFLFPVLLFQSIVRRPIDLQAASGMVLAGLATGAVAVGLAYALPRLPGWRGKVNGADAAASAQVAFRFNSFIGLALAERLAGDHGLQLIAVLLGCCVPLFNIAAVYPMARHGGHGVFRSILRNPLVIATLSGLVLSVAGFTLPGWLTPSLTRLGGASLPLGLLSAGAGMQFGAMSGGWRLAGGMLTIRHVVWPVLAFTFSRLLHLDETQTAVLLAFSGLPTASTCYVLTARMGYNGPFVAGLVTISTLLGLVSLPFALKLPEWFGG